MPQRSGRNSITTRCAMCADGRKATVASSGPSGITTGPMSMLDTMAWCVTSAILGSPVAPEVRYKTAGSEGSSSEDCRSIKAGSSCISFRPISRRSSNARAPSARPVSRIQCRTRAWRSVSSIFGFSTKAAHAPADSMVRTRSLGG